MEKIYRRSGKREAILAMMRGTTKHPSAEWVYAKLKPEIPDLSLGTVYRNIARFQETGEIVRVATVKGQERYDADTSAHMHFICSRCGEIQDVFASVDRAVFEMAEKETGAQIYEASLLFGGLCSKCASDNNDINTNSQPK